MLVAAIIGVVAAITVPRYGSAVGRYHADLSARRLVSELELVRARAKAASAAYEVTFDADSDTVTIAGPLPDASPPVVAVVDLNADPYHTDLQLVELDDGLTQIIFDGFGNASQSGKVQLNAAGNVRTIAIDKTTGGVQVQ